jgi:hypothetical protein
MAMGVWVLAGCGDKPTTSLRGTVTLDGQPLQSGYIVVYGPEAGCVADQIRGGSYEVRNPPLGQVTVVISDGASPTLPGWTPDAKDYRAGGIPLEYLSKATSPLKVPIKEGVNPLNVTMVSQP